MAEGENSAFEDDPLAQSCLKRVRWQALKLIRSGQKADIELTELQSIGSLSVAHDISRGCRSLRSIVLSAKTRMVRAIRKERKHEHGPLADE